MEGTNTSNKTAFKTKLTQLQITSKRTEGIVGKGDEESIRQNYQKSLRTIIHDVENQRYLRLKRILATGRKKLATKLHKLTVATVDKNMARCRQNETRCA